MNLISSSPYITGLPIRDLLQKIQFTTSIEETQIALSMITGLTDESKKLRAKSHLTNATEMDHQIRFPLKDRVDRSLLRLAAACAEQMHRMYIKKVEVNVLQTDTASIIFFQHLESFHISVTRVESLNSTWTLFNHRELKILEMMNQRSVDIGELVDYARERIYGGDYQTAYLILSQVEESAKTDSCHHILGLCCNYFGRTEESEIHFKRLLNSNELIAQIKATYVLSMLYLRLHPKEKQNLEIAEGFLLQGHQLIENNQSIENYYFHSVFNRNGYALCLFRRGKVAEALEMLEAGIQKLQASDDGARDLHGSVLVYNSVQCLKSLERYADCESRCQYLLEIDPLFPEYWLELAIVYLQQEKWEEATAALRRAESLDEFIPEVYALKGYLYMSLEVWPKAIESYRHASNLAPMNAQYKSDLEYCENEASA